MAMVLVLAGMAPLVLLVTDLVAADAPQDRAGSAAAMSSTGIELGLALGVAALGSVLAAVYSNGRGDVPAGVPADAVRESLASAQVEPAKNPQREALNHPQARQMRRVART